MARAVVVGGGFGGMATAARLAKLGHTVTLCERSDRLGGALGRVERDGFAWDAGPGSTTLPAVLRDLFRKTGRPAERAFELVPQSPARRHRFADGTWLALPTGRAAQMEAVSAALGARAAREWTEVVDGLAPVWEVLRREALEQPFAGCESLARASRRVLDPRRSLRRMARKAAHDARLRTLLEHHTVMQGSLPRDTPAFLAVECYVERSFGVWRPVGGMHAVTGALTTRLDERRVDVRTETDVVEIRCHQGAVDRVVLADGTGLKTDVVVGGIDPRRLLRLLVNAPEARRALQDADRAEPALPPAVTHLGLRDDVPDVAPETALHSATSTLVIRTGEQAPAGHVGWTVHRRGSADEDILVALARLGVDVRDQVVARVDRSPAEIVGELGGSPNGLRWAGRRTAQWRPANRSVIDGLYCVGASAHPGAGIPLVGLGAALVAQQVGQAPRRPASGG